MLRSYHRKAAQTLGLRCNYLLCPLANGKRQAALDRFGGIGSALAYAQSALLFDDESALDKLGKAVGILKIPEALVALLRKVLKVNGRDYTRQPAENKQYKDFLYQAFHE